jgi:hypothetical protein
MERVRVTLSGDEYGGLVRLCEAELRNPSDQIRHLLRMELGRRSLLPDASSEEGEDHEVKEVRVES